MISINTEICVGCAYCAMVCPENSFQVEVISTYMQGCTQCKRCISNCPVSAISKQWA